MNVLVTGGAGFIGTHLVRRLLREGCSVAILDNFSPQVHAGIQALPDDLTHNVKLYHGDIRNRDLLAGAIENRDVVVHLAAETGTGQSMYEVTRYQDVNIGGTAAIIDVLVNSTRSRVSKIVLASSRAVYGEGSYWCATDGIVSPGPRLITQLELGQYELSCPICEAVCTPVATAENSPIMPLSFYGLTKQVQEQIIFLFARAHECSAYALRYQNVFGPGQSLRNPYTGILGIFSGLARSGNPIQIFEDGQESRDFVFVEDAVESTWRCIKNETKVAEIFNVGTGLRTTVLAVAERIVKFFGSHSGISITGAFRQGDIRHNCADVSKIREAIGFTPRFTFSDGLKIFLSWVEAQDKLPIEYELSLREMRERGLLRGES